MSALDELIENEEAACNGETIVHPSGMNSRRGRITRAAIELSALRAEVDTRNITIDHLAAENAAMREALGRIVRCVHGTEIVRDTLPAGYGVSSDEVGSPGPWYGLRLESGEERGWSRSYFKMRLADVGAYEPDADFLASIARAALAEKEDRRG